MLRKVLYIFFLVSYCGTFPVLAVAHFHHLVASGDVQICAGNNLHEWSAEKNHYSCDVCSRLITSSANLPDIYIQSYDPLVRLASGSEYQVRHSMPSASHPDGRAPPLTASL